jgi:hypothetical protein
MTTAVLTGTPLLLEAVLGAVAGVGGAVLLVFFHASGARPGESDRSDEVRTRRPLDRTTLLGLIGAVVAAGVVLWSTGWPVAALTVGVVVGIAPGARNRRGGATRDIAKVEAIASWTEQLRDSIASASGLQSAIATAASIAPRPIAGPVQRLAARLDYERLTVALRRFGNEVDHPAADFVVAALTVAAEHQSRNLGPLLGQLAAAARDEAALRRRIWVARARTRTSLKVVSVIIPLMIGALVVLDRRYLEAYDTVGGQVALAIVVAVFAAAYVAMDRLGRLGMPERFMSRVGTSVPS